MQAPTGGLDELSALKIFFDELEVALLTRLRGFLTAVGAQHLEGSALRELLKTVGENWSRGRKLQQHLPKCDLDENNFIWAKRAFNRWIHKEDTSWDQLDDYVRAGLRVLKVMEQATGSCSIPPPPATFRTSDELRQQWAQIERVSDVAMSSLPHAAIEAIPEPQAGEGKAPIAEITVVDLPSGMGSDFAETLQEEYLVKVVSFEEKSDGTGHCFVLSSRDQLALLPKDKSITYRRKKYTFTVPQVKQTALYAISGVPAGTTAEDICKTIDRFWDMQFSKDRVKLNSDQGTVELVEVTPEEEQIIRDLLNNDLRLKGHTLSVRKVGEDIVEVMVYLPPSTMLDTFLTLWSNQFYNIDIQNAVEELEPGVLLLKLNNDQWDLVQSKAEPLQIRQYKTTPVRRSKHRVQISLPSVASQEDTINAVIQHIGQEQLIISVAFLPWCDKVVLHLATAEAKDRLVAQKRLDVIPRHRPACVKPNAHQRLSPQAFATSLPQQEAPSQLKCKINLAPVASDVLSSVLVKKLKEKGVNVRSLVVRDNQAYAKTSADTYTKALALRHLDINNQQISILPYKDKLPWWRVRINPAPALSPMVLTKELGKELGAFLHIKKQSDSFSACFSDEYQFRKALKRITVTVNGQKLTLSDADTKSREFGLAEKLQVFLLQKVWRSKVAPIQDEFGVKISLPDTKARKNTNNPSVASPRPKLQPGGPLQGKKEPIHELTIEITGNDDDKVERAWKELQNFFESTDRQLFTYSPSNGRLVNVLIARLTSLAHRLTATVFVYKVDKSAPNTVKIILLGDATEVTEALNQIQQLANSLTFDNSEVIPSDQVPRLGIGLSELAKTLDLNILEHDKSTGRLSIGGTDAAVSAALELIGQKMGKMTSSRQVRLAEGQSTFIKSYLGMQFQLPPGLEGIGVHISENHLHITGPREKLTEAVDHYQSLIDQIDSSRRTIDCVPAAIPLLRDHIAAAVSAAGLQASYSISTPTQPRPSPAASSKRHNKTNAPVEVQSLVAEGAIDILRLASSGSGKPPKKASRKTAVTAILWHMPHDNFRASQILDGVNPVSCTIRFNQTESAAVSRLKLPHVHKKFNCAASIRSGRIKLTALNVKTADDAAAFIRNFIHQGTMQKKEIRLPYDQFDHIKHCKGGQFIKDLQQRYKISIGMDTNGVILLEGPRSKTTGCAREIESFCNGLHAPVTHDFKRSEVSRKELNDIKAELECEYDVYVKISHTDNAFKVRITSSDAASLDAIQAAVKQLRGFRLVFNPAAYSKLAKLWFHKVEQAKFKAEWNLRWVRFHEQEQRVELIASTEEDALQAQSAFEALMEDTKVCSKVFSFDESYVGELLASPSCPPSLQLALIAKAHKIRTVWNKNKKELRVQGPQQQVDRALQEIAALASRLSAAVCIKEKLIPSFLAAQLEKKGWKRAKQFFKDTGIYINYPDYGQARVMSEIRAPRPTGSTFTVQIACGDIVKEAVECIVNAANEKLEHIGGVAGRIAKKAGPDLLKACQDITHSGTRHVSTGTAVSTPAGNLPSPIKAVIHTVGPRWQGGTGNEESLLISAVKAALSEASKQGFSSIALPAISSGIFGYPKDQCARVIVQAVLDYMSDNTGTSLSRVRLCDTDASMAALLGANLQHLGEQRKLQFTKLASLISSAAATEVAHQWSWQENDGSFVNFDADQNYQIETAYLKNNGKGKLIVTGDRQKIKNGHSYEIDFDNWTEVNTYFRDLGRGRPRTIRRLPKVIDGVVWEAETLHGWESVERGSQPLIELAYANKSPEVLITWCGRTAKAIFGDRMRLDVSGTIYKLRRRLRSPSLYTDAASKIEQLQEEEDQAEEYSSTTRVQLVAIDTDINAAERSFDAMLEGLQRTQEITFSRMLSPAEIKKLETVSKQFNVKLEYTNGSPPKVVLKGLKKMIVQANFEVKDHLDRMGAIDRAQYPSTWEPQVDNCELKTVAVGSPEWLQVQQHMAATVPTINISKIERVQNKWLWEKYSGSRTLLAKKNNGEANEMMLFHGTSRTAPHVIYNGQDGFDLRYSSSNNWWGVAVYFAAKASYSDRQYAFAAGNTKQMFYARVLLGSCVHLAPDKTLRKPPPTGKQSAFGYAEYFDSVSGDHPDGSKVFMVYELNRAYPEYLVTYTK